MDRIHSSPGEFIARHDATRLIELKRGSTLRLEHAAGATVRLVDGEAWLSGCCGGTILIYAFTDSRLRLEGVEHCEMELRRRGEVE